MSAKVEVNNRDINQAAAIERKDNRIATMNLNAVVAAIGDKDNQSGDNDLWNKQVRQLLPKHLITMFLAGQELVGESVRKWLKLMILFVLMWMNLANFLSTEIVAEAAVAVGIVRRQEVE